MRRLLMSTLAISLLVTSCATIPASPPLATNSAKERLRQLDKYVRQLKGIDESPKRDRAIGLARIEQGLIAERVLDETQTSITYYADAMSADPTSCMAPVLLASARSVQHRVARGVREALDHLYTDECRKGTAMLYTRAKLSVLYGDESHIERARTDLEALSTSRMGDTGISKGDVVSLIIYQKLKQGDFEGAQTRYRDQKDAQLWHVVDALMMIGNRNWEGLAKFSGDDAVKQFLLKQLTRAQVSHELALGGAIREVAAANFNVRVNKVIEGQAGSTTAQMIVATRKAAARRAQKQIRERSEVIEAVAPAVKNLDHRRARLVAARVRASLEGGDYQAEEDAYLRSVENLTQVVGTVLQQDNRILAPGDINSTLDHPDVLIDEIEALSNWLLEWSKFNRERAIEQLFEEYASAKARALSPADIVDGGFSVDLDELDSEAPDAVKNVRALMS